MKKRMKLLAIIFLFTHLTTLSYAQWTELNSGTTEKLNAVYFIDENTGYAGGSGATNATLIKTTDGGATWNPLTSNTTYEIVSVFFTSADTGFYFNSNNELFKTIDGGGTWSFQRDFWGYPGKIYFTSPLVGHLGLSDGSRGLFYKTIDGGTTWLDSVVVTDMSGVAALHFPQSSVGYAVSYGGKIAKTIDAGDTWMELNQPTTKPLNDLFFTSTDTGYAVGGDGLSSILLKTTDGGANWTVQTTTPSTSTSYNAVFFTDVNTGYCGNTTIYETSDGGGNWNSMPYAGQIIDLIFPSANIGYAVGYNGLVLKLNSGPTGTNDVIRNIGLKLVPNPSNGHFTVSIEGHDGEGILEVLGMMGQVIYSYQGEMATHDIDLTGEKNGIYLVRASQGGKQYVERIVKQ